MLDAHQLNVFLIAAETLNFTEAAKRLHMTQPSISQHIKSIEKNFGCLLFARKGRHLELTDAGDALVPLARDMVKYSIVIQETMESLKGEVYGHLLVGCSTTPGKYIMPRLLSKFHDKYPQVKISCAVTEQEQSIRMLCSGDVHLTLTNRKENICVDTKVRHFMKDRIVLIVDKEHPWAERKEIEAKELYDESFIMREKSSGTYRAVSEALTNAEINIDSLNTLLTLGNSEAIALSVQEKIGVGFVSRLVVDYFCNEQIVPVEIKGIDMQQDIFLGYQTRHPATAAQIAFWKFTEDLESLL